MGIIPGCCRPGRVCSTFRGNTADCESCRHQIPLLLRSWGDSDDHRKPRNLIRGLIRLSPLSGTFLLIGGLAIAGAPPFSVFLSEFSILRAGLTGGQYLVTGLLALFIIVAFFGIMFQVNHMVFGKPDPVSRNFSLPASCVVALIIAALPVILLGFFIPESIYGSLRLVATSFVR